MKKVFTNKMVSHVWAQQTQEEGRNSSKSLFFENETIYSYGYHFPIAKFIPGTSYVLFNTDFYTKTTRLHQNLVRRAISSDYQFNLPNSIWDNHYDVYQYYLNKANELVKNYRRKSHSTLEHNESEFEVEDGATKARIKSAFKKSLSAKKMNKKVLGEFMSLIA